MWPCLHSAERLPHPAPAAAAGPLQGPGDAGRPGPGATPSAPLRHAGGVPAAAGRAGGAVAEAERTGLPGAARRGSHDAEGSPCPRGEGLDVCLTGLGVSEAGGAGGTEIE